jgi:hypothetical protein
MCVRSDSNFGSGRHAPTFRDEAWRPRPADHRAAARNE